MALQRLVDMVSRFGLQGALLVSVMAVPACGEMNEVDDEDVAEVEQGVDYGGHNNLWPGAVAADPLKRSNLNIHGITSSSNPDPLPLCTNGTITSTGCTLKAEWKAWLNADEEHRVPMMKAITKCAVESTFTIVDSSGTFSFPGQWPLYPGWKSNRLNGQDKRERVSSCILTLLNGNNATLALCIIGPGGSPFSDACGDPNMTLREGGFFGDLFAQSPTAYVAGPDTSDPVDSGRACTATSGTYCCAESDTACPQRIVLAGSILGSADQNYANKRCNAALVNSGVNSYCPSYYSTREPGRSYTNVFTTFVPTAP